MTRRRAILAGDGLLTLAFDLLADPDCHARSGGVRAGLVLDLARASGLGGMVAGSCWISPPRDASAMPPVRMPRISAGCRR